MEACVGPVRQLSGQAVRCAAGAEAGNAGHDPLRWSDTDNQGGPPDAISGSRSNLQPAKGKVRRVWYDVSASAGALYQQDVLALRSTE